MVATASCAEELDVPPAPDFSGVLEAYARPSAEVSTAIMAEVGDELLETRELLEESEVFEEILDVIADVQVELDESTDEEGNLVIPGLGAFPKPNAVLELGHDCEGWNTTTEQDPESGGSLNLTMVLNPGDISPVTFILGGTLGDGDLEIPVERSFRCTGSGELEILWVLESGPSFVYLFNLESLRQGIRDANCTGDEGCSCSLEERQCDLPSGTISW